MITFGWMKPDELQPDPEMDDFIAAEYEELGDEPLDIDWDRMRQGCELGLYRVWAAKDDGQLAGWIHFDVGTHCHYRQIRAAWASTHYCLPQYRPWLWMRLWRTAVCALRETGVTIVFSLAHRRRPLDKAFARLGFEPHGQMFKTVL